MKPWLGTSDFLTEAGEQELIARRGAEIIARELQRRAGAKPGAGGRMKLATKNKVVQKPNVLKAATMLSHLPATHPGEILRIEFVGTRGISASQLAQSLQISPTRILQIMKGRRRITADTALRLGRYFNNSPKFWLGLQNDYDVAQAQQTHGDALLAVEPLVAS